MATKMVRVAEETHDVLKEVARARHEPMQQVLAHAVIEYRRNHFFEALDQAYERLSQNPPEAAAYRRELEELDGTLMDGLE